MYRNGHKDIGFDFVGRLSSSANVDIFINLIFNSDIWSQTLSNGAKSSSVLLSDPHRESAIDPVLRPELVEV